MQESAGRPPSAARKALRNRLARLWPAFVILAAGAAFFASGASRYLTFEALGEHYAALQSFVEKRYFAALALYMLAYVAVAALSLPGATVMSLLGGFLFGALIGTIAAVLSATTGASIIFLAARTALRDFFKERAGGFIKRMEEGFNENAFSYLLLLRLVPLFPFFIVNIVPAFTAIRIRTFVLATFIGIIPGAFAYVSAGNGLGAIFEHGGEVEISGLLLQPEVLTPIIALSLLALAPIIYRMVRGKKSARPGA